jgi:hypothetical protein
MQQRERATQGIAVDLKGDVFIAGFPTTSGGGAVVEVTGAFTMPPPLCSCVI